MTEFILCQVHEDEWWPVIDFTDHGGYGKTIKLTQAEIDRIDAVKAEFRACQKLLAKRWDAAVEEEQSNG